MAVEGVADVEVAVGVVLDVLVAVGVVADVDAAVGLLVGAEVAVGDFVDADVAVGVSEDVNVATWLTCPTDRGVRETVGLGVSAPVTEGPLANAGTASKNRSVSPTTTDFMNDARNEELTVCTMLPNFPVRDVVPRKAQTQSRAFLQAGRPIGNPTIERSPDEPEFSTSPDWGAMRRSDQFTLC